MFLLKGDSKYYDVLEKVLYNGLISGVSLSGDRFFYPNPLESMGQHSRSAWFGCACCPSNVCRFIPSVPGYMYAKNKDCLFVNLFIGSKATIDFNGSNLEIIQKTDYPWNGKVDFTINPAKSKAFEIAVRIPGWAQNQPVPGDLYSFDTPDKSLFTLTVNGKPAKYQISNGYAIIKSTWKKGDILSLDLPMPVRKVVANAQVVADKDKISLQRGPIVYCAEWPDNQDGHVLNLILAKNSELKAEYKPEFLTGVEVIKGNAKSVKRTIDNKIEESEVPFEAIPYYAWANRGAGEMAVWFAAQTSSVKPLPAPTKASKSKISASHKNKALLALNDQLLPQSSNDQSIFYYHWWPLKDTVQWIQYTFEKLEKVSKCKVYWFDDGPWGGCRIPELWKIYYLTNDGAWKEVNTNDTYGIVKDKMNEVSFEAVETSSLKLEVKLPKENASGIYEWIVE
jgi:hypothetical protein